jgi:hypothetical protein
MEEGLVYIIQSKRKDKKGHVAKTTGQIFLHLGEAESELEKVGTEYYEIREAILSIKGVVKEG